MQIITVDYENEKGETIEQLPINFADILSILYKKEMSDKKYPWIMTIDPYGDTTFNPLQWPHLISEFNQLQAELEDKNAKNILVNLIAFLKKNQEQTHTYIKFIGD